jgi:phage head-tail adaptor, putative, SPP1 family
MLMNYSPYDEFPHRIKFQRHLLESDGTGGWVDKGWENVDPDPGTYPALVTDISSREYGQAGGTVNPIEKEVYFPYRTDILPDMRVLLEDGSAVEIKTRPIDQGGQHEIMMIQVTGDELNNA